MSDDEQNFNDSEYAKDGERAQDPAAAGAIADVLNHPDRELSVAWREDERNGGHVQVSVFMGYNPGSRGRCGTITLRVEEWEDLQTIIGAMDGDWLEILPPLAEARALLGIPTPEPSPPLAIRRMAEEVAERDGLQARELMQLPWSQIEDVYEHSGRPIDLVQWEGSNGDHIANNGATWCGIGYSNDALEVEFRHTSTGRLEHEAARVCWPCQVRFHDDKGPE